MTRRAVVTGFGLAPTDEHTRNHKRRAPTNLRPLPKSLAARENQLLLDAVAEAIGHASLDLVTLPPNVLGVVVACSPEYALDDMARAVRSSMNSDGEYSAEMFATRGHEELTPLSYVRAHPVMGGALLAMRYRALGLNRVVCAQASGGLQALGEGFRSIEDGDVEVVLCAAAAAAVSSWKPFLFRALERSGFHGPTLPVAEGAAAIVVEEIAHAQERDAPILAEIRGYGSACTLSDGEHEEEGRRRATQAALRDAASTLEVGNWSDDGKSSSRPFRNVGGATSLFDVIAAIRELGRDPSRAVNGEHRRLAIVSASSGDGLHSSAVLTAVGEHIG